MNKFKLEEKNLRKMKGKPATEKQLHLLNILKYKGCPPIDRREASILIDRLNRLKAPKVSNFEKSIKAQDIGEIEAQIKVCVEALHHAASRLVPDQKENKVIDYIDYICQPSMHRLDKELALVLDQNNA